MRRGKPKRGKRLSTQQSLQQPRKQTPQRRKRTFLKRISWFWRILIIAPLTLIGGVAGVLYFWPQITIEPTTSLVPTDPLATRFTITNNSALPVWNVWYVPQVWEADPDVSPDRTVYNVMTAGADKLEAHAAFSARIDTTQLKSIVTFKKPMMQMWVYFTPLPWEWPIKETGKRFYALPDANGQYQWYFGGQAEELKADKSPPRLNP
ncbi:MAG: hypothetical protein QOI07_199 [Verrucomicrobiota bacterium]|jgi:hypothetical protein